MYLLSRGVSVCRIGDAAVFLDLRCNAYLSVPPECLWELYEAVKGFSKLGPPPKSANASAESVVPSLISRGILTLSSQHGKPVQPAHVHASDALPPGLGRRKDSQLAAGQVADFVASFTHVKLHLALNRLMPLVQWLQIRKQRQAVTASSSLDALLCALDSFRRLRTFAYTADAFCLFDSFVLAEFLHRRDIVPTLVIGVRSKPFSAHAWVQVGNMVVDERLEAVQSLTPVLAV